jgi:hypothetical protein
MQPKIPSNCKGSWVGKDNTLAYCSIHNQFFYVNRGSKQCKYYTSTSTGESKTEKENPSSFTTNSQVNTTNYQKENDLSISSKPTRKYKRKKELSVWERFHNYGVRLSADVMWDALFKYEEIALRNNVAYKRVDLPNAIVKVFKKSILITLRSSKEIVGLLVQDAEKKAIDMMLDTIKSLPSAIKVKESDVTSIHNAFVNHPTARLFKEVFGREMNIRDERGESHEITDNSHHNHELEYIHKDTAVPMSKYRETYEADLIFNRPQMPSVLSEKTSNNEKDIAEIIGVLKTVADGQKDVVAQQSNLVEDRKFWAENQKTHVASIQTLSGNTSDNTASIRELREVVIELKDVVKSSIKESRQDKARKILSEYGW